MINYTMKVEALFLFLILLLGLVLCSFLGGNCNRQEGFTQDSKTGGSSKNNSNSNSNSNSTSTSGSNSNSNTSSNTSSNSNVDNYNHYSGSSSQLTNGTTFTEPNGGTVIVNTSSDGTQSLDVTPSNGDSQITTYSDNNGSAAKFYGPDNQTAVVIKTNDGQQAIKITDSNNNSVTYTSSGSTAVHSNETNTTYYGSTGSNLPSSSYNSSYEGSAGSVTGPQGNTVAYATGPQGNTVSGTNTNNSSYDYSSSLPPGIPASQIIPGQEDLYILKSQVVPPVCPACPAYHSSSSSSSNSNDPNSYKDESKCRPCPAPQRCPEPAFDCKKVPNYSAVNNSYLPVPVLNDFSTFGM